MVKLSIVLTDGELIRGHNVFPGFEICQPLTTRNVTLKNLIKVNWLILVWFERKQEESKPRQLWHEKTGARCGPESSEERRQVEQGGDYFIPFEIHLCQPDDEDSLKRRTPYL